MKSLLVTFFIGLSLMITTQNTINLEKEYTKYLERNSLDIIDNTYIYVNDGDSKELFYYSLSPKGDIAGTLVLFPPTWQTTENVINHNVELLKLAHAKNLLVIIPSINYNLYLDEESMIFLNKVFTNVIEKYKSNREKFVFGGFSLGGMNAIRYTEMAYQNEELTAIKPVAVYGVDPPLDLARLYRSFERTIEKNFSEPAMREAKDYLAKLERQFGGSPHNDPSIYIKHSMYSKSKKDGGNAHYLGSVPVRIYCDPDIDWQLRERRMDYYDMNAVDQTAMINHLVLAGNDKAEFINALGKGYRLDGRRHPHSWSLVEPVECIDWIIKCLK
jgi:hypothetical protein